MDDIPCARSPESKTIDGVDGGLVSYIDSPREIQWVS